MTEEQKQKFHPANPELRTFAEENLKKHPKMITLTDYYDSVENRTGLDLLYAKGNMEMTFIWGNVNVWVETQEYKGWEFGHEAWGIGEGAATGWGFLHQSLGSWEQFFNEITGFHAQSGAVVGGILQVNFFKDLKVVGQFNAGAVGETVIQCGGNGTWKKS